MTVIVYRDGVLAADSSSWTGDVMCTDQAQKVERLPDGRLLAGCGNTADIDRLKTWVRAGEPATFPRIKEGARVCLMVVANDGVRLIHGDNGVTFCESAEGETIGCNSEFVRGLLACGKSAEECVEIAIERCAYVGGHVVSMRLVERPVIPMTGLAAELAEITRKVFAK